MLGSSKIECRDSVLLTFSINNTNLHSTSWGLLLLKPDDLTITKLSGQTLVKPGVLQNDKEYQLEVDVSSDEKKVDIKVSLDQKQIIHFVGVPSQVSLKQGRADSTKWVSPIKGQMSIGITQATYQFKDLRVLEK